MKPVIRAVLVMAVLLCSTGGLQAQSIRVNVPFWLGGSPNIGMEFPLSRQFTVGGEALWMPYMFKKNEKVFRALQATVEFRYYVSPRSFYTNDVWDGFYIGPYAMYGNYNVGWPKKGLANLENDRRVGWGVSTGVTTGYKFSFNSRWGLDLNIGFGYVFLQYDKYPLGGEYATPDWIKEKKVTENLFFPTKVGINLTYSIFR